MTPDALIALLRQSATLYQLPNTVDIMRSANEVDANGGIVTDWRLSSTVKARVVQQNSLQDTAGQAITSNNEWTILLPFDADIRLNDRIYIQYDEIQNRYFDVVGSDRGATDGLFTSCKVEERTR
ncbi:Bacteriophage SPP1, head-tail adaptor [uncultured Caudovirales phage]|uniref:Bacteriophage SPP1, head-tail adaptor n=1 Tax=uncultured Caudovirales phage TaxID=2100421 RepID=A0A6J7WJ26_9CAUD|nr:Bacteriophage SPP1, head-tail adaptor [uncultured Caudovirales phage]